MKKTMMFVATALVAFAMTACCGNCDKKDAEKKECCCEKKECCQKDSACCQAEADTVLVPVVVEEEIIVVE